MSFRAIIVNSQSKLEFRQNYVVVRTIDETKRIFIDEITLLIVETTAVSITAVLLKELMKRNISTIFCDNERNPCSNLIPLYGSYDSSEKIRVQINWNEETKDKVWTNLVKEKVKKQGELLKILSIEANNYFKDKESEITINDPTNVEAQAAKKYFHFLFGNSFTRKADTSLNAALNYGYMILLSLINREVSKRGYLTQLGIHHNSIRNQFNLSCDLVEPLRPIVDREVFYLNIKKEFGSAEKYRILNIFRQKLLIDNKRYDFKDAVDIYCSSIFNALQTNDISKILFYNFAYGEK